MNSKLESISHKNKVIQQSDRLPLAGLIAIAMAGFICMLTETIPAGLLIPLSRDLGISESLAGQLVTAYAFGSLIAAIPLTTATQGWNRKPLLLSCIFGFLVFNTITALSSIFIIMLIARFFAGVTAGVLWGMSAGYARQMAPESLKGKAMAVAMVSVPLALAVGVPLGTFLGSFTSWRLVFGILSLLALMLMVWILWKLPDYPGQAVEKRIPLLKVLVTPGVRSVLLVLLALGLSHNILYTYIAPYLSEVGLVQRVDLVLLIFGVASLVGVWIIGVFIDRKLRFLVLISLGGFALASTTLGIGSSQPIVVYLAIAMWGLTFGGAPTLLQTAIADAAGEGANVAQSMYVTVWNLAIGGGGVVGAILLMTVGVGSFPLAICILLLLAFIVVYRAHEHGFPSKKY
ncbi:MFS transporter [Paenibacillus amylolyticus]|uniref:Sugar efflux transporter n=1 Tax=Paenibacillus amylolyticus TaxID=1451 RepID=A0A100VNX4_PAEAM|nr:MFS transporter [Paenibacillus amylolyticus]GAS83156.1 sugar efflux transporter [Paenibacillus amylolyticus]